MEVFKINLKKDGHPVPKSFTSECLSNIAGYPFIGLKMLLRAFLELCCVPVEELSLPSIADQWLQEKGKEVESQACIFFFIQSDLRKCIMFFPLHWYMRTG